jgi:hypothetical protein
VAVSITTIPAPYRAGFAKIKRLSPTELESLATALEDVPATGRLKGLTTAVAQLVPSLRRQDVDSILRTLFSLSVLLTDEETPLSENLSSLTGAMQASDNRELALSDEERVEFEKRLERLLTIKGVALASKVRRLELEYPNTFHDAIILTDIRPVFDKPEKRPVGCSISHTLRITYHQDGDHKEFYVVMDSEDLEAIKKVLQRAEAKESSVKSFLKSVNLDDLS